MAITLVNVPTWGAGPITADQTVTLAAHQAGDRIYVIAMWKPYTVTATIAGWTELIEQADGTVADGVGVGSVKVGVWYKDAASSSETNPLIDFSAAIVGFYTHYVFRKDAAETWDTPSAVTAAMTTWTSTSQTTAASSTVNIPSGALVLGIAGIRDDSATFTRPITGIDAAGVTWNGNYVESPSSHAATNVGNDLGGDAGYRLVTTGGTGITLTQTATLSAAETGMLVWVVQNASPPPNLFSQVEFRGRNDDGSEALATWKAAVNTNWTQVVDQVFRLRLALNKTSGISVSQSTVRVERRRFTSGAWGSWASCTTSSTIVVVDASANLIAGDPVTDQIGGTGVFRAGRIIESPIDGFAGNVAIASGEHTEWEFVLKVVSADVVVGDLIEFRAIENGLPLNAYTATPQITAGAAGTLLTRTTTDTITAVSDSVGRVVTFVRTMADTITAVTESVVRSAISFVRTVVDTITISDSVNPIKILARSAVDTITSITDTVTRVANKVRTNTDTTSLTESASRLADKTRSATDAVTTVTESLSRGAINFVRSLTDVTTLSESLVRQAILFARTTSDSLSVVTDSIGRVVQLFRSAADTIVIGADTVVATITVILYRTASDTISIGADAVSRVVTIVRGISDATVITDSVARISDKIRDAADTLVTSDAVNRVADKIRSIADNTVVSESAGRVITIMRSAADAITSVSDVVSRASDKIRSVIDVTSLSESISRQWQGVRSALDTLPTITDTAATNLAVILYRTAADTISIVGDSVVRIGQFARAATETITTSDSLASVRSFIRSATDITAVTDYIIRGSVTLRISVADTVPSVSDIVSFFKATPGWVGEFVRERAPFNRWNVGQDGGQNNIGGGSNRINIDASIEKKQVK